MEKSQAQFGIQAVAQAFEITGHYRKGHRYGSGHINDTFYIETDDSENGRYILQRINQNIFTEPVKLMENVLRVTLHVRAKMAERGKDPDRHSLNLVPAKEAGHA